MYLRIPNNDQLCIRAVLVEGVDLAGDVLCSLLNGGAVAIPTCCWVVDGFAGGAGVRVEDQIDEGAGGTIARWGCGFSGAEDVDVGTALARLKTVGLGESGEDEGSEEEELEMHCCV